jgi:hypothetical protein
MAALSGQEVGDFDPARGGGFCPANGGIAKASVHRDALENVSLPCLNVVNFTN